MPGRVHDTPAMYYPDGHEEAPDAQEPCTSLSSVHVVSERVGLHSAVADS